MADKNPVQVSLLATVLDESIECNAIHEGVCILDPYYSARKYGKLINSFLENTKKRNLDAPILLIERISSTKKEESYNVVTGFLERTEVEHRIVGATENFVMTVKGNDIMVASEEVRLYDPE